MNAAVDDVKAAINRAVQAAGGQSAVARALSTENATLTPQAVGHWCRAGRLPAERVLPLESLQQEVKRAELRPDLYPRSD